GAGERYALARRCPATRVTRDAVLGHRGGRESARREIHHRLRAELFDPLLGEEHRGGLAATHGDAARGVLKARDESEQPDRDHGRGDQHLTQCEAARLLVYCTLTRPEAATATLRVPPLGFVTVNVPANAAAPSGVNTTGPPVTCMLFCSVTMPFASVPLPVQTAPPVHVALLFCR